MSRSRTPSQTEDVSSASWFARARHIFVLTSAGRPVFARYGDEHALAGFFASVQALLSFCLDNGDVLQSIVVGRHRFVFMRRGQLLFLAVTRKPVPLAYLARQLRFVHSQILFMLTEGGLTPLKRNPGCAALSCTLLTHRRSCASQAWAFPTLCMSGAAAFTIACAATREPVSQGTTSDRCSVARVGRLKLFSRAHPPTLAWR